MSGIWVSKYPLLQEDWSIVLMDIFYFKRDTLFIKGFLGCDIDTGYLELQQTSENEFELVEPKSCAFADIIIKFHDIRIQFSDEKRARVYFIYEKDQRILHEAFDIKKKEPQALSLNNTIQISNIEPVSLDVYALEVPPQTDKIVAATSRGLGNCDLILVYSKPPYYMSISNNRSTTEKVSYVKPEPGLWYLLVWGPQYYYNVSLAVFSVEDPHPSPYVHLGVNHEKCAIISQDEEVSIDLTVNPSDLNGHPGDWWLLILGENSWYYFDLESFSFLPGFRVSYQGPLSVLDDLVLRVPINLTPGKYTIYFGFDSRPDGQLNLYEIIYDRVELDIRSK